MMVFFFLIPAIPGDARQLLVPMMIGAEGPGVSRSSIC